MFLGREEEESRLSLVRDGWPDALPAFLFQKGLQIRARGRSRIARGWRALVLSKEFFTKLTERIPIIDIVPRRQKVDIKIQWPSALDGLLQNAVCAPGNIFEQRTMQFLQSDKIIASVARGTQDEGLFWLSQNRCGLSKNLSRHSRAVGIDQTNGGKSQLEEILHSEDYPLAEGFAALRNELEFGRQNAGKGWGGVNWRVGGNAPREAFRCKRNGARGVAQKTSVERRGFRGGERGNQARFHVARTRSFCHNSERAEAWRNRGCSSRMHEVIRIILNYRAPRVVLCFVALVEFFTISLRRYLI
jgi:hypothetical protein